MGAFPQEAGLVRLGAGERVGMLRIRLFQPFPAEQILAALPTTVRAIAVLDRTKEPGAVGEPLYMGVVAALSEAMDSETPPFAVAKKAPMVVMPVESKKILPPSATTSRFA